MKESESGAHTRITGRREGHAAEEVGAAGQIRDGLRPRPAMLELGNEEANNTRNTIVAIMSDWTSPTWYMN